MTKVRTASTSLIFLLALHCSWADAATVSQASIDPFFAFDREIVGETNSSSASASADSASASASATVSQTGTQTLTAQGIAAPTPCLSCGATGSANYNLRFEVLGDTSLLDAVTFSAVATGSFVVETQMGDRDSIAIVSARADPSMNGQSRRSTLTYTEQVGIPLIQNNTFGSFSTSTEARTFEISFIHKGQSIDLSIPLSELTEEPFNFELPNIDTQAGLDLLVGLLRGHIAQFGFPLRQIVGAEVVDLRVKLRTEGEFSSTFDFDVESPSGAIFSSIVASARSSPTAFAQIDVSLVSLVALSAMSDDLDSLQGAFSLKLGDQVFPLPVAQAPGSSATIIPVPASILLLASAFVLLIVLSQMTPKKAVAES